jgi:TonB family protein
MGGARRPVARGKGGLSWTRSIQEGLPVIGSTALPRRHAPALAILAMLALAAVPLPARTAATLGDGSLVSISTPPPDFPDGARRAHQSGYIVVSYTVGVDGKVGNARVVESTPHGVFDHAVLTTLARWRFEPPATPREVTHTFYFDE